MMHGKHLMRLKKKAFEKFDDVTKKKEKTFYLNIEKMLTLLQSHLTK